MKTVFELKKDREISKHTIAHYIKMLHRKNRGESADGTRMETSEEKSRHMDEVMHMLQCLDSEIKTVFRISNGIEKEKQ